MKKIIALALSSILALSLVACGGSKDNVKDGTYKAIYKNASHGSTEFLEVTYKGGEIVAANIDAIYEDGSLKSQKPAEEYPMDPPVTEWMPELNKNIVDAKGNPDKIVAVAGATNSSANAKELLAAVIEGAKNGNQEVVVENEVG